MSRNLFLHRLLRSAVFFSIGFLALFAQVGQAADAHRFFKDLFVTGNYVAGGVGLRGKGINVADPCKDQAPTNPACPTKPTSWAGSYATGSIVISGLPVTNGVPADVVAAFLYWQTDEPVSAKNAPLARRGVFDGHPIVGAVVGNRYNPACDTSTGSAYGRVYRADVRNDLFYTSTNGANGTHTVSLRDIGNAPGSSGPITNGATLVIVYRVVVAGQPLVQPLRAVVIYDGAFSVGPRANSKLNQTMAGFYQAYPTSPTAMAKMTQMVGNGQPGFKENLNITDAFGPSEFQDPFQGKAVGLRWDNPTFPFNLNANESSYNVQVTTGGQTCINTAGISTSMRVVDTDNDAILDVWETKGLHLNDKIAPATFGGCSDYPSDPVNCVDLPAMGANPSKPDIFVEMDWLKNVHEHKPKYEALSAIGDAFAARGISLHFDVGNNYQGPPPYKYIIPYNPSKGRNRGVDVIDESDFRCPSPLLPGTFPPSKLSCVFDVPYAVLNWKEGLDAVKDGFALFSEKFPSHFDPNRKIFHYALLGHATATYGFNSTRQLVALKTAGGEPLSNSGGAEVYGGDFMVTLGLWRYDDPADDQVGTSQDQAGTIMHELGHNLGLFHGGLNRLPNCKPNYQSVMNYLYQTRLLTAADNKGYIDLSSGKLNLLNENSLSKAPGSMGNLPYRVRFFGPTLSTGPKETEAKRLCTG